MAAELVWQDVMDGCWHVMVHAFNDIAAVRGELAVYEVTGPKVGRTVYMHGFDPRLRPSPQQVSIWRQVASELVDTGRAVMSG